VPFLESFFSLILSYLYDLELLRKRQKREAEKKTKGEKIDDVPVIEKYSENQLSYQTGSLALGGIAFVCAFIPSFNAFFSLPELQASAVINTIIGVTASIVTSAAWTYFQDDHKFSIPHILTAAITGGVALGCAHNMFLAAWASSFIGVAISIIVLSLDRLFRQPGLKNIMKVDHTSSFVRHGVPGILGAISSMIVISAYSGNTVYGVVVDDAFVDNGSNQALYHLYGLLISLGIPVVGAVIAALTLNLLKRQVKPPRRPFIETKYWLQLGTDYSGAAL